MKIRPGPNATARSITLAALAAVGIYIAASALAGQTGFPLDDSWIHQTYARNLSVHGQWAYVLGQPSGGSTSPFWTLLLSAGHLLSKGVPYTLTFTLGALALALTGWSGQRLVWNDNESRRNVRWPWFGVFLVFEWHLVWAGASGMETALMAAMILLVFWLLSSQPERMWLAGLAIGLSVWVRPDGVTLLGPAVWVGLLGSRNASQKIRSLGHLLAGFLGLFLPYLLFNQVLEGTWWPNTYYAKQAEYAVLLRTPLAVRFINLAAAPLIGPGLLLLPGFVFSAYQAVLKRNPLITAAILWWLGYTLLYALRLPVTYQHARYLMPAMPVFFWLGWAGWQAVIRIRTMRKSILFGMQSSLVVLTVVFLVTGASAYSRDVQFIESQMVDSAEWARDNLPSDALLAIHDIGAIGYFTTLEFVDLAGLVTPEVIPFIQDEERLAQYLDQRGVEYLIVFPDWYHTLPEGKEMIFQAENGGENQAWEENMAVYRWSNGNR